MPARKTTTRRSAVRSNEEVRGRVRSGIGKAKEQVGRVTGNQRLIGEGQADRIEGAVRRGVGRVSRKVDDAAERVRGMTRR